MSYEGYSAERLYSEYKQAYNELYSARHDDLTPEELGYGEEDQRTLEFIRNIEAEVEELGTSAFNREHVQDLLTLRAEAQNTLTRFKAFMRQAKIIGAKARYDINQIIEDSIVKENLDGYHEEALAEDAERSAHS